jgi:hypothetical protein
LLSTPAFAGVAVDEAWKGFSAPEIMSSGFTHLVRELPFEGSILSGSRAWSGHYWPSKHGSINHRWNSPRQEKFDYKSPTREQVAAMSLDELAMLSASEKYDLFLGRYDYPLKKEASGVASRLAPSWAGICHGWAPAALHHSEPVARVVTNPDGIRIPFASADIKAVLSYFYAFHYEVESTHQMGLRCFFGSWVGGARGCDQDLNAGAFHIVMANKLGLQNEGFLMDKERFNEVWNQPVVAFKSRVIDANLPASRKAAKTAVREQRIATELFYTDESDPVWDAVWGTPNQVIGSMQLQYRIEIDREGRIVGGEWESKERPDFLWKKSKAQMFPGLFVRLPELLVD